LRGYLLCIFCFVCAAQAQVTITNVVPPQDPLITLMLAQPRIEIGLPVTAISWFEPPVVRPGQLSFYRVIFNALEESIDWPAEFSGPEKLALRPGARGQTLQPTGTTTEPRTTFSYRAYPTDPGEIVVPAFTVQVYGKAITVPAARLKVASTTEPASPPPVQLILDIPTTKLFVGQPATVRIILPGSTSSPFQGMSQIRLVGDGFIMDQGAAHQKMESSIRNGMNVMNFIHESMLIPVSSGKIDVFAQGFTASTRAITNMLPSNTSPNTPLFIPQLILIESQPVELTVQPLPKDGELPGFTGAIGSLTLGQPKLSTNVVRIGEPVKLSVTVQAGNFSRLVAPPAPRVDGWQIMTDTSAGEPAQMLQARGAAILEYTMIPMDQNLSGTPLIPFSCFEPNRAVYKDLTIPSLPITVVPGTVPADIAPILQAEASPNAAEEELVLSGLATAPGRSASTLVPLQRQGTFKLLQIAPIVAFLGLWAWDRRRRYLEAYPQILVRRRARRALRREKRALRRAAACSDVSTFANSAVRALRVGAAPHFPAEPDALVAADILQLLGENGMSVGSTGAATVRRLFAITDESRFAVDSPKALDVLGLHPDLEQVLENLEAKL
jgi:hypothetical protein